MQQDWFEMWEQENGRYLSSADSDTNKNKLQTINTYSLFLETNSIKLWFISEPRQGEPAQMS